MSCSLSSTGITNFQVNNPYSCDLYHFQSLSMFITVCAWYTRNKILLHEPAIDAARISHLISLPILPSNASYSILVAYFMYQFGTVVEIRFCTVPLSIRYHTTHAMKINNIPLLPDLPIILENAGFSFLTSQ